MAATLTQPRRTPARRQPRPSARPSVLPDIQHFVFEDVSWAFYEQALREVGDGTTRLTYDEGRLEIMSPLAEHERPKQLINTLIVQLAFERRTPLVAFGSTTFRLQPKRKGLEPDQCYYIQNHRQVQRRRRIDLRRDPPPDLAVEVDVTSPSVPREPIYAAMGVPELWRYDGRGVRCMHLIGGAYRDRRLSLAFPHLNPADLEPFLRACELLPKSGPKTALLSQKPRQEPKNSQALRMRLWKDDIAIGVAFVKWVRRQGWPSAV